jgi:Zn-finger in Ran binding protein and others
MQANVRGKLFSMLGDRGEVAAAAAAASSSSRSPNKSNVQPGSTGSNGKSVDNNVPPEEYSLSHLDGVEIGFVDDSAFDYSDDNEEKYEWVCSTCTLINEPDSYICVTCESLRFQ